MIDLCIGIGWLLWSIAGTWCLSELLSKSPNGSKGSKSGRYYGRLKCQWHRVGKQKELSPTPGAPVISEDRTIQKVNLTAREAFITILHEAVDSGEEFYPFTITLRAIDEFPNANLNPVHFEKIPHMLKMEDYVYSVGDGLNRRWFRNNFW